MNQPPRAVLILDSEQSAPEGAIVVRRSAPDKYFVEESGVQVTILPDAMLRIERPKASTPDGVPATVQAPEYQFLSQAKQWVTLKVHNGDLQAS